MPELVSESTRPKPCRGFRELTCRLQGCLGTDFCLVPTIALSESAEDYCCFAYVESSELDDVRRRALHSSQGQLRFRMYVATT